MNIIFETLFDILYLCFAIGMGLYLLRQKSDKIVKLYGIMSIVLGLGDAFHLVPRIIALNTTGLISYAPVLGFGKVVTSITMTIFYLILYKIYIIYYKDKNKKLTKILYILAAIRILLCLLPQNKWLLYNQPLDFSIYRNIPFTIMGIIIIYIFYKKSYLKDIFKTMYIAIFLSFAFYIPVVLFADKYPLVGMLMMPKTVAYAYIVFLGYKYFKNIENNNI